MGGGGVMTNQTCSEASRVTEHVILPLSEWRSRSGPLLLHGARVTGHGLRNTLSVLFLKILLDLYTVCRIVCVTQDTPHGRWLSMVDLAKLTDSDLFENLRMELRRGSLIIAVLAQLREEHYGYALRKRSRRARCIHCYGGWKRRACWKANGARKTSGTNGFTASRKTGRTSSSNCSRNGTA